jgi:protein phosphatase
MPWSAKVQELLRQHYAPVGNAGLQTLLAEQHVLAQARERVSGLDELADRTTQRLHAMQQYVTEYRHYCWLVNSLDDFKLAPFHLLASEAAIHADKRHTWHMEMIAKLCEADERLLLATPFQLVDLNDTTSCDTATAWWTDMTAAGREGMVMKPLDFISRGRQVSLSQPSSAEALSICGSSMDRSTYCLRTLINCDRELLEVNDHSPVASSPWGSRV